MADARPRKPPHPLVARADAVQRRHPVLAVVWAVQKRFGENHDGRFVALLAYYGFFSIFPMLLAFVSVLGLVLDGHPGLRNDILDSAFANFPVIGTQLKGSGGTIGGSGFALAFGLAAAIWAGLGAVHAAQDAMDTVWAVPHLERPRFVARKARALLVLLVLGGGVLASTAVAGAGAQVSGLPGVARVVSVLGTVALNAALLAVAFRLLTVADVSWNEVRWGALFGGVLLYVLQLVGSWYLTRVLAKAGSTYGTFATVIGLLTWIALQARVFVYAAELDVVLARRLWPRALPTCAPTDADRRAQQERIDRERVEAEAAAPV